MSFVFWTFVSYFARGLVSLRYRIEVRGIEQLNKERLNPKEGILFLPNHPAHMDPLILFLWLWPKFRMRPLVVEYVYRNRLLRPLLRLVKALPIPNFETSVNQLKIKIAEQSVDRIVAGLKKRGNFAFYPSGRLKNTGKEILGGASGAQALVQKCPDVNIVLVRTEGLWGSSFSRALLGRSPDLTPTLLHGVRVLLKNLIFFSPRRKITVTFEPNPEELPRKGTRVEFNRFLENWYNHYRDGKGGLVEEEPLRLVSYSMWRKELPKVFAAPKRKAAEKGVVISKETRYKIYAEIQKILENPSLEIKPEMHLAFDLGMDSLNIAELITYIMKNYDVEEVHPEDIETVETILEIAEGGGKISEKPRRQVPTVTWTHQTHRLPPFFPEGRIIPEAFLYACRKMGTAEACGDDLTGVLSYKKLQLAVLVLAAHFAKTIKEERVGVLLPASVGAYLIILALQFAHKVPVMLNWTLGPRYLSQMMKTADAKRVITSWRFLDRVSNIDFGDLVDQMEVMEDIRRQIGFGTKMKGALLSRLPKSFASRAFKFSAIDENSPAVILFTSGTEAAPKGVPLSHKNILSNQRSAMRCIGITQKDVFYGVLPPFHSFGFSVAGLFPILGGIKIAFYPDPTDSFALAEGIHRWKATLFLSAPSFLRGLFAAAKKEQLGSVRLFVSGAEKASKELYKKVDHLDTGARLLEGYGITECAPILTISREDLPPKGVGRLLPDIELCTIHPETQELLPKGSEGEICVRGPNVFHGYLGHPRTPFIDIDHVKWYRTGDLGYLDLDGNLILSGRLKRFTKVGGEMISLGAIEEALIGALHKHADTPTVAVIADEKDPEKSRLIVFTTSQLEKEKANEILKEAGFSRLVKISGVQKVKEIPLLGTGKTDYRTLQSML